VRSLGLDIGEKRIGVAISDDQGAVATPLDVLDAARVLGDGRALRAIVEEYDVDVLVIGLPLSLDGTEGPQARRVRTLARRLTGYVPLPVVYVDERLTSIEAARRMREGGLDERQQRGTKDKVAAAILLQTYLDSGAHIEPADSGDD